MYKIILELWSDEKNGDSTLWATDYVHAAVVVPEVGGYVDLRTAEEGEPYPLQLRVRAVTPLSSLDGYTVVFRLASADLSSNYPFAKRLHDDLNELGWDVKAAAPKLPEGADEDDFEMN